MSLSRLSRPAFALASACLICVAANAAVSRVFGHHQVRYGFEVGGEGAQEGVCRRGQAGLL